MSVVMQSSAAIFSSALAIRDFSFEGLGHLVVPDHPIRFGFQIDVVPENCPSRVIFGLIARDPINGGPASCCGFAVRLDLENREIWDVLNGAGLVGWVEHPLGLACYTDEEPLLLGWEIELHGHNLIPKLQVGDQQWLYPTIHCLQATTMEAVVGWEGEWENGVRGFVMHRALWREQLQVSQIDKSSPAADAKADADETIAAA
jgi:hypothetical protein